MGKEPRPGSLASHCSAFTALAAGAMLTQSCLTSWRFAEGVTPIAGPNAERLSIQALYSGLPEVADFLLRHPDRQIASWLIHPEDRVTSFDPSLAVGALIVEAVFPRRMGDIRTSTPAPMTLVVMPHGTAAPWPHRVALTTPLATILEIQP